MIEPKRKKCKGTGKAIDHPGCGKEFFKRTYGLCQSCYADWLLNTEEGREKMQKMTIKAVSDRKKNEDKEWKQKKSEMKKKLQTHGEVANQLQAVINKIVRLIDKGNPCMMCNNPNMKRINGCHYHSVGSNPSIRFNLFNNWHGCHSCNSENGGNIPGYDIQLMNTYGRDHWEYIKFDIVRIYPEMHLSKDDMRELKKEANKIVRELEKLDMIYTPEMRWKLRQKYNERLGIHIDIPIFKNTIG